ncbi:MAG: glycosyltransferase [Chloroflexi bacterium]|nr:MAG: glycosyltransferase [Chloroflexota bacterium]
MKVLHVIPAVAPRYGGPSQAVLGMGCALMQHGVEVLIATTDADGRGHLPAVLGVPQEYQGVPVIFFPRQWSEAFKYSRPLAAWLAAHVSEFSVLHIHAVFSHASLAAAAACRQRDVPYLVRTLGTLDPWSLRQKPMRKRLLWHLGARRMMDGAAAVQYTTRAEQRLVEHHLGLRRGVVIPLGIDQASYTAPVDLAQFSARHSGLNQHPYILVLGRLHPKKGVEALIAAFLRATRNEGLHDWRLVVAGDGDEGYVAHLRRIAREQSGGERVVFTGWVAGAEKLAVLRGAAVLALPSHQENFGLVVVEALSCGVPVLVSPHVNLADDIQAAGAGWVVPLDAPRLEAGLVEVMALPEERQCRGSAGRDLAARFSWPQVAAELTQLYRRVERTESRCAHMSLLG